MLFSLNNARITRKLPKLDLPRILSFLNSKSLPCPLFLGLVLCFVVHRNPYFGHFTLPLFGHIFGTTYRVFQGFGQAKFPNSFRPEPIFNTV